MEVVPASVGEVSRRWDDEHLDLQSAAEGIEGAPTHGFTSNVSGAAVQFTAAWSGFAAAAGTECETRADALRATIQDYLETDQASSAELTTLAGFLRELR